MASGDPDCASAPDTGLELSQYDNFLLHPRSRDSLETTMEDRQVVEPMEAEAIVPTEDISRALPAETPVEEYLRSPVGDLDENSREDAVDYTESPLEELRRTHQQDSVSFQLRFLTFYHLV